MLLLCLLFVAKQKASTQQRSLRILTLRIEERATPRQAIRRRYSGAAQH
jgi:hypothetical protein